MGEYFESAKTRIKNINWEYEDRYRPSHVLLLAEFQRRANIFLDHTHKDLTNRRIIFCPVREIGIQLPINIEKTSSELNQISDGLAKALCTFYLEMAYLVDQEVPIALQFHDLYEPIIKLYERGGRIRFHNGFILCALSSFPVNIAYFPRDLPPRDIGEEALVKKDNEWYHEKITSLLKRFRESLNLQIQGIEEEALATLDQLQKYNHATSKILIIYIEVAKKLLTNGIYDTQTLKEIKVEIENFRMYDEEEIPEPERQVVSVQVEDILNKISGKVE